MKTIRPTLMLLLLVSSGCAWKPVAMQREIAMSSDRFAWDLYAKLAEKEGNLFFSPSSIHTALAMTSAGADGNTLTEMAETLRLPREVKPTGAGGEPAEPVDVPWSQERVHKAYGGLLSHLRPGRRAGYQLHVANALWGQKGYTGPVCGR